jgi:predicted phosphodiesterase
MRIAIVSDIHGNRTAFDAVLVDLRQTSPDVILHGGDLAHGGANPAEIIDRIRNLRWEGVMGNTDEMLPMPETLTEFGRQTPKLQSLCSAIEKMAAVTREWLGPERLTWLRCLPRIQILGPVALIHASPESTWRAPMPDANDTELDSVYRPLGQPIVVYAHIHRSYVRNVGGMIVANTDSVSLSYLRRRSTRFISFAG